MAAAPLPTAPQAPQAPQATQATLATQAMQATQATLATQAIQATQATQATQAMQATQTTQATQATQATQGTEATQPVGCSVQPHSRIVPRKRLREPENAVDLTDQPAGPADILNPNEASELEWLLDELEARRREEAQGAETGATGHSEDPEDVGV